jgi:hypothetical protein
MYNPFAVCQFFCKIRTLNKLVVGESNSKRTKFRSVYKNLTLNLQKIQYTAQGYENNLST